MSVNLDTLRPPGNISETSLPYNQSGRSHGGSQNKETDANVEEELTETIASQCPGVSHLNSLWQQWAYMLSFSLCLGNQFQGCPLRGRRSRVAEEFKGQFRVWRPQSAGDLSSGVSLLLPSCSHGDHRPDKIQALFKYSICLFLDQLGLCSITKIK